MSEIKFGSNEPAKQMRAIKFGSNQPGKQMSEIKFGSNEPSKCVKLNSVQTRQANECN